MGQTSSSLYQKEDLNYPNNVYPDNVEIALTDKEIDDHLKTIDHEDEDLHVAMDSLTLDRYKKEFKSDKTKFDCFDVYFQNLALLFCSG